VITLVVLAAFAFCAFVVVGVLGAVMGLAGFVISLPFRLLGWTLKLVTLLIALPFLLVGGLIALVFGLLPFAPIALLTGLVWWLFRDRSRAQRSHASVAS